MFAISGHFVLLILQLIALILTLYETTQLDGEHPSLPMWHYWFPYCIVSIILVIVIIIIF